MRGFARKLAKAFAIGARTLKSAVNVNATNLVGTSDKSSKVSLKVAVEMVTVVQEVRPKNTRMAKNCEGCMFGKLLRQFGIWEFRCDASVF